MEERIRKSIQTWVEDRGIHNVSCIEQAALLASFHFTYTTDTATYEAFLDADDEDDFLSLSIYFPLMVPAEREAAVTRLMMRQNAQLRFGAVEHGGRDGRLRYRVTMLVGDENKEPAMVDFLFVLGNRMVDEVMQRLVAAIFRDLPPEEEDAPIWPRKVAALH